MRNEWCFVSVVAGFAVLAPLIVPACIAALVTLVVHDERPLAAFAIGLGCSVSYAWGRGVGEHAKMMKR